MSKILIIAHGFHDGEINVPKTLFEHSGHTVKIAGMTRSKIVSRDGTEFLPDFAIHEVNPDYFNVVIVVGKGARELSGNMNLVHTLRKMALKGKIVCGVTTGPLVLAAAGLLTGKRATVSPEAVKLLKDYNTKYEDRRVVRDENILTADDPESSEELVRDILKIIG